jgi:hypothetical protein
VEGQWAGAYAAGMVSGRAGSAPPRPLPPCRRTKNISENVLVAYNNDSNLKDKIFNINKQDVDKQT